ncbi:hypothetical protein B0I27_105130 [Arcticibacter pallidicorallinus]|uniref:Uncharacterized protein n=1 Tax=Arcticibacter pallidicorallinus TaxID=1259464 RepID=A0A2T0U453_9SPHI|nr:hypothetical protein B0I27_105130 [Arcticibacter pallidicorallinus]
MDQKLFTSSSLLTSGPGTRLGVINMSVCVAGDGREFVYCDCSSNGKSVLDMEG